MTTPTADSPPGWYQRNWRWFVLGTLFYATFLNYLDRQTLSIAIDPVSKELGLDSAERGHLLAAFVYAYAFSHLFIGFILDRVRNIRWFFPAMLMGWSLATILIGFAHDHATILWLRYLLGVFEAVNFPISFLIVARIFPARQRAFASGVFMSGAVLATLIAPKLVIYLSEAQHWRYAFYINGALGVLWVVPWFIIFRNPEKRSPYWKSSVAAAGEQRPAYDTLRNVLGRPAFWAVTATGVGIIPGLYFMTQWLPSYFTMEWKMDYGQTLGNRLMVIYLMQDLGSLIGGGFVWFLISKGLPVLTARKTIIAFAYLCTMSILLLPAMSSVNGVVVLVSVYIFGLAMWMSNHSAFKQEVNRGRVATVAALVGFAETGFAAFVVHRVGSHVQEAGGFAAVFLFLASFLTGAFICSIFFLRNRWLELDEKA